MKTDGIGVTGIKTNGTRFSNPFINFEGKRINRNLVAQLSKSNPYSLTEPNQRAINTAIGELSSVEGLKNVKFLMNTAAKSKYSTKLVLEDKPRTDWKGKLIAAALAALSLTQILNQDEWIQKIKAIGQPKNLNNDEKRIMKLRNELLKSVDLKQIEKETIGSTKDFKRNLDYLIVSSETTLEHKRYVLERLNYFMSDDYEINPQLRDKKSIAVAEMINDMAIAVPGNKIPNIKAINQRQHGMCAAIAIVRKKLAYEDKPNYVDSIISELDSNPTIMVYDRSKLGSGERIPVLKVPVDFDTALSRGYRIIDASTMHWMQIAGMNGRSGASYNIYNPFDKDNFDVKTDTFFNIEFDDKDMAAAQSYYQALVKAKEVIENYKAMRLLKNEKSEISRNNFDKNTKLMGRTLDLITEKVLGLMPDPDKEIARNLSKDLIRLEHKNSAKISDGDKFAYIPNEEPIIKKQKVKDFLNSSGHISALTEEQTDKILDLIEYYNSLRKENSVSTKVSTEIGRMQYLYEIGAAFRYQIAKSLDIPSVLINLTEIKGVPDKETLILDTIDTLIEKLENNSQHSEAIINSINRNVDMNIETNQGAIDELKELKQSVMNVFTEYVDDIYKSLGIGNRHHALITHLENIKEDILNGNEDVLRSFASKINIKPEQEKALSILNEMTGSLETGDNKAFQEIYSKLLGNSQVEELRGLYMDLTEELSSGEDEEILKAFLEANGLPEDDNPEPVIKTLQEISQKIDDLDRYIGVCQNILKITSEDGEVLYSANPKDAVLKKLENDGYSTPSYSALKELQVHLDKIKKARATSEFGITRGKLKDKSLYKLSKKEKETLKSIELSIDALDAYVGKQLTSLRSELKDPLESLKRLVGVNEGSYWVREGSSGLFTNQEITILEYMTGRPHYATQDIKSAVEKIKTSPFSGITSSSVYNDRIGYHAQYIADIAPVKIKVRGEDGKIREEEHDVLFHDNTWGATEHENTWVDSKGLTRTDYSDRNGGSLGYITDENFRNGNLVERILGDMVLKYEPQEVNNKIYRKIKHTDSREEYSKPQYEDIILDGKSPELYSLAAQIHDTLFAPSYVHVKELGEIAGKMTEQEALDAIEKMETASNSWVQKYREIRNRILNDGTFGEKIRTKEEYDKLPDDDYLKIVLERIALEQNGSLAGSSKNLTKVKNINELGKFKKEQRRRAIESFKYSFGKNSNIVEYLAKGFGDKQFDELFEAIKQQGSNITQEDLQKVLNGFEITDFREFDGSMQKTINLILGPVSESINTVVKEPAAQKAAKNYFKKFLAERAYFKEVDIQNENLKNLVEFIDRVYDPADDKEFVKIYRTLQDMTLDEFKKDIIPKATRKDLGLKDYTGYDILKKLQMYEEKSNISLINTIYYDQLVKTQEVAKQNTFYKYRRFTRTPMYRINYDFEKLYRMFKDDLELLTLKKAFNKYKGRNIENYEAYPAYPMISAGTEELYEQNIKLLIDSLQNASNTIRNLNNQKETYSITHKLKRYVEKLDDEHILSDYQYKNINNLLGRLITINYGDETISETLDSAAEAMEIQKGAKFGEYRTLLNKAIDEILSIEASTPKKYVDMYENQQKQILKSLPTQFVITHIQNRYQGKMNLLINEFIKALAKGDNNKAEDLYTEINEYFRTYHRLNNPTELLKEFIKSHTKDSSTEKNKENFSGFLTRSLSYAMLADIQQTLMNAISEGLAMDAKMLFNSISVTLLDKGPMPMSSDEIVRLMTHSLIIDENIETALMFLDKLGLNDQYVEYTAKNIDFDGLKKQTDEALKLAERYGKFKDEWENIKNNTLTELTQENPDFIKILDKYKRKTKKLAKENNIEIEDIFLLFRAADITKDALVRQKANDCRSLFNASVNAAEGAADNNINNKISAVDESFKSTETVVNLINQVLLNQNSPADTARAEMNEKYQEICDYIKALTDESNNNLPTE